MRLRAVTAAERPDLWQRSDEEITDVWPEYNLHGDVLNEYWGRLDEEFADFQFVLHDDETDAVARAGPLDPVRLGRHRRGPPRRHRRARRGRVPAPRDGRRGEHALGARHRDPAGPPAPAPQRAHARRHARNRRPARARRLIAPLRPTWKERYPLTPIERYADWTRDDGLPFDPWIRLHVRLGGQILAPEARSLRITGRVADWEEWTKLPLPESGSYVFPHGLAPLEVDRERNRGEYWEPNVWMRHRVR